MTESDVHSDTAPAWLVREVAHGLQGLLALRLIGAPPEDSITLTLDVWLVALQGLPLVWDEQQDAARIRAAFKTLYRRCDRWPAPKNLIELLPSRTPQQLLSEPHLSTAQRQAQLEQLAQIKALLAQTVRRRD